MEKKKLTESVCKIIARIHTDFPEKFGVPRQSGLIDTLYGTVTFEPAYRDPAAVRGLDEFSHIWLLWQFSQCLREGWSPTVRPPRLGGNTRMGVFATRSPYRPNAIGLSCVRLLKVVPETSDGLCFMLPAPIWWTVRQFMISSPIFLLPIVIPRLKEALPSW